MDTSTAVTVLTEQILFHTDAPDLVQARDEFGAAYLCLLVRLDETGHHFLAIKVTDKRIVELRSGEIDLRTTFKRPEQRGYFSGHIPPGERLAITLEPVADVPEAWFPQEGFLLSEIQREAADDSILTRQSVAGHAAVIVCQMNPKEARGLVSRVDADRLAGAIKKFQYLVRQSAKIVVSRSTRPTKKNASDDPTALQVVAFSPGSFNVHFESRDHANLFGETVIGTAMRRIDLLMDIANSPVEGITAALEPHRGAVVAAYYDLLRFIDKNELPFAYQWSEPASTRSEHRRISPESARAIAAVIETEKTLAREAVTFSGRFTSVQTDQRPFSWTARDGDEHRYIGAVHETQPNALSGVTIKTQQYAFDCEQRLVTTPSGDPAQRLFLRKATPLGQ